jgi:hypothetical protein
MVSVIIISAAMHARHFKKELMGMHVWRQTETQSAINNFYEEDMNIFNPRRNARGSGEGFHRMEFPLMQWLVAGLYKIFGQHLVISRLFMFITGLFSVLGIYKMIKYLLRDDLPAVIGAWAFNFSPSFYYYTINPLPDNFALCCAIWGMAMFFYWKKNNKPRNLFMSGIFLSLAALCKLPFILYFSVPLVFFLLSAIKSKQRKAQSASPVNQPSILNIKQLFTWSATILLFALMPVAWYAAVVPQWEGNGIVQGILGNQASWTVMLDNLKHHLFITLTENLLNYGSVLFFLAGFYFIIKCKKYKNKFFPVLASWGLALILFFFFELNMIGKSHDYYLFPFLPLLFILVSYGAWQLYLQRSRLLKTLVILLLLVLPITAALRIDLRWNPEKPGFNKDLLVYKDELRNAVPKDALCIAGNDYSSFIFFYYIDKKGWGFYGDNLGENELRKMVSKGAKYMYSDSREVESNPGIANLLDELILEHGSVNVYSLKQDFLP